MADIQKDILINVNLDTGDVKSEVQQINQQIGAIGQNPQTVQSFSSIKQEIRSATNEAIALKLAIDEGVKAGENVDQLRDRYNQVTDRAANLRDAVQDVNQRIANQNPDNRLQSLISITQGAIATVQGLAGAFTLVGVDAEDANVAVAKLQGLLALGNAVGQIDQIKNSFRDLSTVIQGTTFFQQTNNAATVAATTIQRAFGASVVGTGAAFNALKVAIIGTGIGALVVALGLVINAISEYNEGVAGSVEETERLTKAIDDQKKAYDELDDVIKDNARLTVLQLRQRGASEREIRKFNEEQALIQFRLAQKREQDAAAETNRLFVAGSVEAYKKSREALEGYSNATRQALNGLKELQIQNNIEQAAEDKKAAEDRAAKQKQKNDEFLAREKVFYDFLDERRIQSRLRQRTTLEQEIIDIDAKYKRAFEIARRDKKDTVELERLKELEIGEARLRGIEEANRKAVEEQFKFVEAERRIVAQRAADARKAILDIQNEQARLIQQTQQQDFQAFPTDIFKVPEREQELIKKYNDIQAELTDIFKTGARLRFEQLKNQLKKDLDAIAGGAVINFDKITEDIQTAGKELKIGDIFQIQGTGPIIEANRRQADFIFRNFLRESQKIRRELLSDQESQQKAEKDVIRERLTNLIIEQQGILEEKYRELTEPFAAARERASGFAKEVNRRFTSILVKPYDPLLVKQAGAGFTNQVKDILSFPLTESEKAFVEETKRFKARYDGIRGSFLKSLGSITEAPGVGQREATVTKSFTRNFLTSEAFKERFDELLKINRAYYQTQIDLELLNFQKIQTDTDFFNKNREKLEKEHKDRLIQINRDFASEEQVINDTILQNKLALFEGVGGAIGRLGDILTQNTVEQKALAISEIAINTGVAFMSGLRIAQRTAEAKGPGAAYAFPIFYAQQVAAILAAARRAADIINRGKEGGAQANTSVSAPNVPQVSASLFNLPQEAQNVRVVNEPGTNVVRAFITNEDLRTNAEKQNFLNKLSSF